MADSENNLWLDVDSSERKIMELVGFYDDIVRTAEELCDYLDDRVGKKGKWYDENSDVFARWWNQSKKAATGGKLLVDGGKLAISGRNNSDGEDKIKFIIQLAGRLFCLTASLPLDALKNTTSGDVISKQSTYKNVWRAWKMVESPGLSYKLQNENHQYDGTTFSDCMFSIMGAKRWTGVELDSRHGKLDANTNITTLKDMSKKVPNYLGDIQKYLGKYTASIDSIATNTTKSLFWGIDNTQNIIDANRQLKEKAEGYLNTFWESVKTALEFTAQKTDGTALNLKSMTFTIGK